MEKVMVGGGKALKIAGLLAVAGSFLLPGHSFASATYTYDSVGRLTTALYDNGVCVAYTYDANGNRTALAGVAGGAPQTAIWGTGTWGCMVWTAASMSQLRRSTASKRNASLPRTTRAHASRSSPPS